VVSGYELLRHFPHLFPICFLIIFDLFNTLDIEGLPTALRARQPSPHEAQRGTPGLIHTYRATRPTGQQLALKRQALIQQLDGIGACHAPDLRAHADSTALVSAGNGIAFDKLMAFFYLRFKQWTHRIIFWVK
jgi:hypothetical protein